MEGQDHELRTPTAATAHDRVAVVDGFRALALFAVVAVHLSLASGVIARYAGTNEGLAYWMVFGNSIDLFFIISGFVLFFPVVKRGGVFGSRLRFWVRRGARLLPAYWLVLALCLVLLAVAPPAPGPGFPSPWSIAGHITAVHQPALLFAHADFAQGFGLVGAVWMISVVVAFYVVLPFVAGPFYRRPMTGLLVAAALTLGWKEMVMRSPQFWIDLSGGFPYAPGIAIEQAPGWAFSFALGMAGARLYIWSRERWTREQLARTALLAAPAVLALYLYGAYLHARTSLDVPGAIGTTARSDALPTMIGNVSRAAVIGLVMIGPLWMQRPFANRPMRRLAELSYGVYLIHMLFITYLATVAGMPQSGSLADLLLWTILVVPASLVWAYMSRRFVEIPARRRIEDAFAPRTPSEPPGEASRSGETGPGGSPSTSPVVLATRPARRR
jgi:peptidoglycan/LPS O-acetylase OafA/YrhL